VSAAYDNHNDPPCKPTQQPSAYISTSSLLYVLKIKQLTVIFSASYQIERFSKSRLDFPSPTGLLIPLCSKRLCIVSKLVPPFTIGLRAKSHLISQGTKVQLMAYLSNSFT
ncbi:hypothetical protein, partial [Photobacterium gaetbulicola]|uniref:hypothetical protein n=1 Tax=Photobacterium gaetbulicola TaxID=1295392 RepID=UPI001E2C4863